MPVTLEATTASSSTCHCIIYRTYERVRLVSCEEQSTSSRSPRKECRARFQAFASDARMKYAQGNVGMNQDQLNNQGTCSCDASESSRLSVAGCAIAQPSRLSVPAVKMAGNCKTACQRTPIMERSMICKANSPQVSHKWARLAVSPQTCLRKEVMLTSITCELTCSLLKIVRSTAVRIEERPA